MIILLGLAATAQLPPGFAGRMFAPGVISTPLPESGGAFSPDGAEFYFTLRNPTTTSVPVAEICVSRLVRGHWTRPRTVPFSGRGFDYAPALSPDGRTMVFTTARAADGGPRRNDTDLWIVSRDSAGRWGESRRLPEPINSEADEQGASIAPDGSLYFSSGRPGGLGSLDIYRAPPDGRGGWTNPLRVDALSSEYAETQPSVSRDGNYLFFVSSGRPEDFIAGGAPYPRGDIWVSIRTATGWSTPKHLDAAVNTAASETYPVVSPDGRTLIFTSEASPYLTPLKLPMTTARAVMARNSAYNGGGNIYSIPLSRIRAALKR